MELQMQIDLTEMKPGEIGIVVTIHGGHNLRDRVHNLGIREGKKITKISTHFWHGPQTVTVDNTHAAIGHGMSKKIIVEVER